MKQIKKRLGWLLLFLGVGLWSSALIGLDWVLNYSIYHGMADLWIAQIPLTNITVYWSPWQTYPTSIISLHVAAAIIYVAVDQLRKVGSS